MNRKKFLSVLVLSLTLLFATNRNNTYAATVLADVAAVGQYVTYNPTVTSYNVPAADSGYTSAQNFNPSTSTSWRIFSINTSTKVINLISTSSVGGLYLKGSTGCYRVVKTLTNLAAKYVNDTYASGSRALGYKSTSVNVGSGQPSDTTYTTDLNTLTNNNLGLTAVWFASRNWVNTSSGGSSPNYWAWFEWRVRVVNNVNGVGLGGYRSWQSGATDSNWSSAVSKGVRPIIKLKASVLAYGGPGTSSTTPWILTTDGTLPTIGSITPNQYLNSSAGTTASVTASGISDGGEGLSKIQCWYRFLPAGSSTWGAWVQNTPVSNTAVSYTYSCPITNGDGRYQVAIRAIDKAENYSGWIYTNVYLDKMPPTVGTITMKYDNASGSTYTSNTLTNRSIYFSLNNGSDNYSGHKSTTYALYKNGVIVTSAGTTVTTLIETGTYKIVVTTTDEYGNTSKSGEYMIRIDKTPPMIATLEMRYIDSSGALYPVGVTTNKNVYVVLRGGSDTEGSVINSYIVNGVSSSVTSQTFKKTGTYSIVVTTTDMAGNQAISDPYIIDIYKTFKVSINVNNILDNLTGVATVNVYFKESSNASYENVFKTFNNPGVSSTIIAIKENVPEGIYDIKVECVDRVGNISQKEVKNYIIE